MADKQAPKVVRMVAIAPPPNGRFGAVIPAAPAKPNVVNTVVAPPTPPPPKK